jgi:hypothetical protein
MKTVLQQAIEEIEAGRDHAKLWAAGNDYHSGRLLAYTKCLEVLNAHLPTEKEQIQEAHYKGQADGAFLAIAHKEYSEVYYISNFQK